MCCTDMFPCRQNAGTVAASGKHVKETKKPVKPKLKCPLGRDVSPAKAPICLRLSGGPRIAEARLSALGLTGARRTADRGASQSGGAIRAAE